MSDFVKAIPYFAEYAKREGPEALANFFEFIAANSVEEAEEPVTVNEYGWIVLKQEESSEVCSASSELNGLSEKISPIPLVQTSESLSEAEKLWVEQTFDRVCKVMSPEDSVRLRAILITTMTILSQTPFLYRQSCQLAALVFQWRLLLRPLPEDSFEVKQHKRALLEEYERVSLEPSRIFL